MRCAQQPRGLPPWARAGLVSLSSGWSAHRPRKPAPCTPSPIEAGARRHSRPPYEGRGNPRAQLPTIRPDRRAVSSRILDECRMLRYNRATHRDLRIPCGFLAEAWNPALSRAMMCVMTGDHPARDPHARSADPGLRELDPARARRRAAGRPRGHRAHAARAGHVRARRPPASRRASSTARTSTQSDVFVGIYGASYGWVAPDEEISGLEDEYDLAPARHAQAHLHQGVGRARRPPRRSSSRASRADDTAAYLPFRSATELEEQVAADLATLLAERFDESRIGRSSSPRRPSPSLAARMPVPYTTTIGRDAMTSRRCAGCSRSASTGSSA